MYIYSNNHLASLIIVINIQIEYSCRYFYSGNITSLDEIG